MADRDSVSGKLEVNYTFNKHMVLEECDALEPDLNQMMVLFIKDAKHLDDIKRAFGISRQHRCYMIEI